MDSLTQGGGDSDEIRTEGERRDRRGVKRAIIALLALLIFLFGGAAAFVGYLGLHGQRQRHPRRTSCPRPARR